MLITELRSKSQKIAVQARELLDTITDENRGEKVAEFERMMAESDDLAQRAEYAEKAEARTREFEAPVNEILAGNVTVEGRSEKTDVEKRGEGINAYLRGDIDVRELRAMGITVPAEGGYTVPKEFQSELIKGMKVYGPLNEGGPARSLVTAGGNQLIFATNDDTGNEGFQVAENAQINDTDLTFGQTTVGAWKYSSGIFKVPAELLADSGIDIAAEVNAALAERLGRAINKAFTIGNGTTAPQGVATAAGAGVTAASATAVAFDELIKLEHSIDPAYRANAAYMFNDATLQALRVLKNGNGDYIWQPSTREGAPSTINGRGYHINQAMASIATGQKSVLYGEFGKFLTRRAGGFVTKRLNERFADLDQTGFLGLVRIDSKLLDSRAIKALVQA